MRNLAILVPALLAGALGAGTTPVRANERITAGTPRVYYTIEVVERTLPTVNYVTRAGTHTTIEVEYDDLPSPSVAGKDYLTLVLWAITPEGRATNLGEVVRRGSDHTSAKLNVTTELQAYGLIVTAEPYFAVSKPSNAVVL